MKWATRLLARLFSYTDTGVTDLLRPSLTEVASRFLNLRQSGRPDR
jgi:hypothetical protein